MAKFTLVEKNIVEDKEKAVMVDGFQVDEENQEFNNAAEFVERTNQMIYLTGKAGTGKTTFLKYIKQTTNKNTVVLAPTGVAAINAGGITINSFFQLPFSPFIPNDSRLRTSSIETEDKETIYSLFKYNEEKKEIIKNLELLIIDEVSMVRCDTIDVIDRLLKVFRNKPYLPFGGVQVVLIGDIFQLPPIAKKEEWSILKQFYEVPFFFSANVIKLHKPIYIELKKIYRQNEKDFIGLLNRVRLNKVTREDFKVLNSKYNPRFTADKNDYITLATHNKIVNETNLTRLKNLNGESFTYNASITGVFPKNIIPTDNNLKLKKSAQIMFIKNDIGKYKRYYNGKIGKIKELKGNKIVVVFDDESIVLVEKNIWSNIRYTYNKEKKKVEEEVIGTFEQFPIKLAWAITIHKSQGLTFEKVIADLGKAFNHGQVYVALSRCTSFNGLVLKTRLHSDAIKTDAKVIKFAQNETPSTLVMQELKKGKANFYYKEAREHFNLGKIKESWDNLLQAIKFRNDIETKTFERFVLAYTTKLFSFKGRNVALERKFQGLKNELLDKKEEIAGIEIEVIQKKIKLRKQDEVIRTLISRTETEEKKNISLKRQITEYESINNVLRAKNSQLKESVQKLKRESQNKDNEILRLKNIKWYQKLFGTE